MNRWLFILLSFLSFSLQPAAVVWSADRPLHLGILALRSKAQMQEEWQPLADYLGSQLPGYQVHLHVLDHQEIQAAQQQQQLDFVLTNPSHFIVLKEKFGLSAPLATIELQEGEQPLSRFGGVIFARSNRDDIENLFDIKRKKIACTGDDSEMWGGFQMQVLELRHAGIDLAPQQLVTTGLPLDLVIEAVMEGKADVGFVRTGLIEQLERQGKVPVGSLKILNRQDLPDFSFASSTPLYPEWPCVALPHVDTRLAAKVAAVLLQMEAGAPPLQAAGIHAFTIPADYSSVENVLRELRLPPFDTGPQFDIKDVVARYRLGSIAVLLAVTISGLAYLSQRVSTRRLQGVLCELGQQQEQLRTAKDAANSANRALLLLSTSNRTLLRSTNEDDLLFQVCRIAVEIGGYNMAWVGMAQHDEKKTITPIAWCCPEGRELKDPTMSWGDGERGTSGMGAAIRTGAIQLRRDILNDPKLAPWHEVARSHNDQAAVALPLQVHGEVIGALAIYAPEPMAFEEEEVELLDELACDLAFGIESIRTRDAHAKTQTHVRQLAYFDRLTGLPNRFMFLEQLDQDVAAASGEGQGFSLLMLDLNHLREINETHGHTLGDQIIDRVARRLQEACGQDCFVARFGGDDFTVICPGVSPSAVLFLGETIHAAICSPCDLSGKHLSIGGSIGIVLCPEDGKHSSEILSKVALAASRAKESGGGVCFYRPEMGEHLARTVQLAHRLEIAIRENALELFYQPKVDLLTGQMVGAEALLRWNDPELGWISPAELVPIAESRGMMVVLGNWVLRTACRQIRQWRDEGILCSGRIAVNVSARQLEAPDFLETITTIIEEEGVTTLCLELELTESVLMTDPERAIGIMVELKNRGLTLALDDFGTGYSSLAYLKRFPLDTLKIDRAFVRDMLEDQNDRAIVSTIVAMAQQLGLTTVAEGVEEDGQRLALQQLGCQHAQGFYFSRPLPVDEFTQNRLRRQ